MNLDVGETVMIESWNADGTSSVKYRGANWVAIHRQGVQPILVLAIPRAAVLSDQQGDYVYVVDAQDKAAEHVGHHVTVKGSVDGDNLKLASISMAK